MDSTVNRELNLFVVEDLIRNNAVGELHDMLTRYGFPFQSNEMIIDEKPNVAANNVLGLAAAYTHHSGRLSLSDKMANMLIDLFAPAVDPFAFAHFMYCDLCVARGNDFHALPLAIRRPLLAGEYSPRAIYAIDQIKNAMTALRLLEFVSSKQLESLDKRYTAPLLRCVYRCCCGEIGRDAKDAYAFFAYMALSMHIYVQVMDDETIGVTRILEEYLAQREAEALQATDDGAAAEAVAAPADQAADDETAPADKADS